MPTIFTHPAVSLALGVGLGRDTVSPRLMLAGVAASIVPDIDVVGFWRGVPYGSMLGHRGFTHSLVFAVALGVAALAASRSLQSTRLKAFVFVTLCAASHGLLDMLTNGGLGIAFFWPVTDARYFFPVRPIEVSPLNVSRVFEEGLHLFGSELAWVWLPCAVVAGMLIAWRKVRARSRPTPAPRLEG